ncbi:hypothetical protein KC887_09850 [Candidatus Kaiserbacteria bacterium]|nr:hypothetical protein [Candidatus Kaiserbacteria bacterium]
MPIKNREQFFASQWTLDELSECLGGRRGFTDVDALTERHGKFLLLEFKHPNAMKVPTGQHILLKNITQVGNGDITAIVVWGEPDKPIAAQIYKDGECGNRFHITKDALHNLIKRWDAWADAH